MVRVIGLWFWCISLLSAQTFTARLTGTVSDPSQAAIAGATVFVKQTETGVERRTTTDASGTYSMPLLLPGVYEVRVEMAGLQPQARSGVRLEVNQTATLDFKLSVADVSTAVTVTDELPVLQSENSGVGLTLETRLVEDFPLPERDVMGLLRAIPGVISNSPGNSQVGSARANRNVFNSNFSVGGGRTSTNETLLDGAPNTIGDFNGVVVVPPQDAVQEFRVETNSYSAEFGRSGGGVVNIVTKAGTNKYHGSLDYANQNNAYNANTFVNNRIGQSRARLNRHFYSYTVGGPVWIPGLYNGKNKTFFFSAFEGRREADPVQGVFSVPTEREAKGDFSATQVITTAGPIPISIYDPFSSRVVGGQRIRDAFPGNIIPVSRQNPIAQKVITYYPQANRPGNSVTGRGNYAVQGNRTYTRNLLTNRVDHYFTERHRLFGRFTYQRNEEVQPFDIVQFGSVNDTLDNFRNINLDDTWQITARLNAVTRISYTRFRANLSTKSLGFDPTTLGLPEYYKSSANVLFFPNFSNGSFSTIGGNAYNNQPRDTQGVQENLVYSTGRHSMRFGAEYRLYRFYPFQVFNPTGSFSFSQAFTQRDQIAAARPEEGFGFASMLLGVGSFSFERVEPLSAFHHYMGAWFHDDYKVSQKLTLNLGLRWDIETGTAESHNRLAYFDPNEPSPIKGAPNGAIVFAGVNGRPRSIRAANTTNFAPRIGAAYRIDSKTVVRAAWGLFFLPLGLEPTIVTTPYNYTVVADNLNTDYTPKVTLSNPFPGGIPKPPTSNAPSDATYRLGNNANVVLRDQPASYTQQWNFAMERQIARTTGVNLTYFGSRGVHLPAASMELNQMDPVNLARGGAALDELVPNPYASQFTSGLMARATVPRMQLLKPYPQYANPSTANAYGGALSYFRPPVGDSVYHAATLMFKRGFTKGLAYSAHYTFSKLIDNVGAGNGAAFLDSFSFRDVYNLRAERSVGSFDVPHRLVVTAAFDLPFGRGKRFLNRKGWTDRVVGGWTLFGFQTIESGRPVEIRGQNQSRLGSGDGPRANVVAGQDPAYSLDKSRENARAFDPRCLCTAPWFNTSAFALAPVWTVPNGPRLLSNVRSDTVRNLDVQLIKRFKLWEGWNFQFEASAWNLLNQVTFAGPSPSTVNAANFGSAGGLSPFTAPRRLEVGAKIRF